jgi:hypothetical protein
MPDPIKHILRFGTHSEQECFLDAENVSYDAVMMNANMLAYTPKAMATFVLRLDKGFFVDPQTHAFQHGYEFITSKNGSPKRSIQNLAKAYGEPILSALENKSVIKNTDFDDAAVRTEFVKKVLNFQLNTVQEVATVGPEAEYVNFALNDASSGLTRNNLMPRGVIAPYFFLDKGEDKSLSVNKDFLIASQAKLAADSSSIPLFAQIVISKEGINDKTYWDKVVATYAAVSVTDIFLWVDGFDETEASEELLKKFQSAVTDLTAKGKKVFNLYGGYFSILLTKKENGLSGVCHGMEYGESRKVVPVGGGLPKAKYYFPPLHKRLRYEDFKRILNANPGWEAKGSKDQTFAVEVCNCKPCENLAQFAETITFDIKSKTGTRQGSTPTSAAKECSLEHYLLNKKKEFIFVEANDMTTLLSNLETAKNKFISSAGTTNVEHLERWKKTLSL